MRNEFPKKVRDLFDRGGYMVDWETGKSDANCLHHIMGRVSNSPYNAAPLNNQMTHMPEGRTMNGLGAIHSRDVVKRFLNKTKKYLDGIGYKPNKKDIDFLSSIINYLK